MALPKENAALVRRFVEDAIAGGETAAIEVLLADDVVGHNLVSGARPKRRN